MRNTKRIIIILLSCATALTLSGCWNYRGLNEMVIVSGLAVDKDYDKGLYKLTFEILNLVPSEQQTMTKTKYLESEGETIFDAIRSARNKVSGKLYFGNTQLIVIGQELAKREKISSYIDMALRDAEFRETSSLVIFIGHYAKDFFDAKPLTSSVLSYEIGTALRTDNKFTSSTSNNVIYKIYNHIQSEGSELTVPAIRCVENGEDIVAEVYGSAVFRDEKLVDYIDPDESKYMLIAQNKMKGGVISLLPDKDGGDIITLEVSSNKTSVDVSFADEKVKIEIKIVMNVFLGENMSDQRFAETDAISELQDLSESAINENLMTVIKKAQNELKLDIFCFGTLLSKTSPAQWRQVGGRWEKLFPQADVTIDSEVIIRNTALIGNK